MFKRGQILSINLLYAKHVPSSVTLLSVIWTFIALNYNQKYRYKCYSCLEQ